jgi:predicted negative regulator of RcsB-dependent stress response
MIAIQKLVFSDGAVKFTRKQVDDQPRTLDQVNADGIAGFKEGRTGEIYDYLNRGMLVSANVVYTASSTTEADKIKKILADYEHGLGTKVLDYKE